MLKNKLILISSTLIILSFMPLTVACKNDNKFNIPEDLKDRTFNNYGIFFNQKITAEKANITSKAIYDRLIATKNLDEIQKIIEKYVYLDFSNINKKKYDYKLNIKKTKYHRNSINLVFNITDKKDNITVEKTFVIKELKDYVDEGDYHQIANLHFFEMTTSLGSTITSQQFIDLFKEELAKSEYKNNGKKQLDFFKKYCLVNNELDENKYEIDFIGKSNELIKYLHHHGPDNIHMKVRAKDKTTNKWEEFTFFVYEFNSKVDITPFTLRAKENAKSLDSIQLIEILKKDSSFKNLLNYFELEKNDDFLDYVYEIDNTKFETDILRDDYGNEHGNDLTKFTMTINQIDRFNKNNKRTFKLTVFDLNTIAILGYLKIEYLKTEQDDISFYISNVDLKKELQKPDFENLNNEKQIEKLIELLNKGFDDDVKKPVSVIQELKSKYKMKLNTKSIKISSDPVFAHTIIELEFEIINLETNQTITKAFKIHGLDY